MPHDVETPFRNSEYLALCDREDNLIHLLSHHRFAGDNVPVVFDLLSRISDRKVEIIFGFFKEIPDD